MAPDELRIVGAVGRESGDVRPISAGPQEAKACRIGFSSRATYYVQLNRLRRRTPALQQRRYAAALEYERPTVLRLTDSAGRRDADIDIKG
jgi:hypothetical protein